METLIASTDHKPSLWLSYVDDVFSIRPHRDDELKSFLQHLNTRRTSIKFIIEKDNNEILPFVDDSIDRKPAYIYIYIYTYIYIWIGFLIVATMR